MTARSRPASRTSNPNSPNCRRAEAGAHRGHMGHGLRRTIAAMRWRAWEFIAKIAMATAGFAAWRARLAHLATQLSDQNGR